MGTDSLHADTLGTGPRLVLVHGFTQTGRCWLPLAGELSLDHEVVMVDAPGHGRSASVEVDLVSGARLLGEVGGRATYIGYSMGGRLALHLGLLRPDLVERMVLVGATAGIDDPDERAARRLADEALAERLETVGVESFVDEWLDQPLFAGLTPDAAQRHERLHNTTTGLASSLRLAGTGTQAPLWDRVAHLEMPVLLVAGEGDVKFTALAERLAAAIGPNARTTVIAGAGHSVHLEQPAAFLAALRAWLAATDHHDPRSTP